jgi:chemotaxis signal transduction protein
MIYNIYFVHRLLVYFSGVITLFSLVVDKVGDVVGVTQDSMVKNPDNLSTLWQKMSLGIFPMQEELVVMLDLDAVMETLMSGGNNA